MRTPVEVTDELFATLRRSRNKTFRRKADADAYDAKIKLDKRAGELRNLDAGKQTLREFHAEWKRLYAEPQLAKKTLLEYERYLENDILPALGQLQLRRITPLVCQRFAADLDAQGRGNEAIRKMLAILQGILQRAVEWEEIQTNPVRAIKKPPANTRPRSTSLPPPTSNGSAPRCQACGTPPSSRSSPTPASGLVKRSRSRGPTSATRRSWSISRSRWERPRTTKTRINRTVPLRSALAQDLREWKLASGRPDDSEPVFPSTMAAATGATTTTATGAPAPSSRP